MSMHVVLVAAPGPGADAVAAALRRDLRTVTRVLPGSDDIPSVADRVVTLLPAFAHQASEVSSAVAGLHRNDIPVCFLVSDALHEADDRTNLLLAAFMTAATIAAARDAKRLTIVRAAAVAAEDLSPTMAAWLGAPALITVRGARPKVRVLHREDAASALAHVLNNELRGVVDLAAPGWLDLDEVAGMARHRVIALSEDAARASVTGLHRLGWWPQPMHAFDAADDAVARASDQLAESGWQASHSARDACADFVEHVRDRVFLGPVVVRKTIARATTVGFAVAGASVALAAAARARADRP